MGLSYIVFWINLLNTGGLNISVYGFYIIRLITQADQTYITTKLIYVFLIPRILKRIKNS